MCKIIQYRYGLCHHDGWKQSEYCHHAFERYDEQMRYMKQLCASGQTTENMQVPGLCHECGVRALAAEREALAARDSRDLRDPRPRDPWDPRDPRDPADTRLPRDPSDPRYPMDPRDPRYPRSR